jgi:hypothetical protein
LTVEVLNEVGGLPAEDIAHAKETSAFSAVRRSLQRFSLQQIKPLFATKKLGLSSTSSSPPSILTEMLGTNKNVQPS